MEFLKSGYLSCINNNVSCLLKWVVSKLLTSQDLSNKSKHFIKMSELVVDVGWEIMFSSNPPTIARN